MTSPAEMLGAPGEMPNGPEDQTEGLSISRVVWMRFTHHRIAMIAAVLLALTIILVYSSIGVGSIHGWWKWNFTQTSDIANAMGRPTMHFEGWKLVIGSHPFGQDEIGRDIFARVMRGAQQSLMVMVIMGLIATTLGVFVGAFAGYFRGRLDNVLMRTTEVFIAIPAIVVTAVIGRTVVDGGALLLAIVLGLVLWPPLARLVRAEFLGLREREFVDAARVAGASDFSIMFKHILPNAMGVIIVNATLLMAIATILEASLSYLGFGVRPPDVSLGNLINEYNSAFATRPWLFWWPGAFIITFALSINLIGDGLRDAFDPRQRRIPKGKDFVKPDTSVPETDVEAARNEAASISRRGFWRN
jgi:ABC-type dipeptide/oligopeptide/nickel transport system permease subunit